MKKAMCVFCERSVKTRKHHIVPRCKGGTDTVDACETCELFIHKTWNHNELRDIYNNVETIKSSIEYQKFVKWLLKQKDETFFASKPGKNRDKNKYR